MRPAVTLLAVLATAGVSLAFADPPDTPAAPKPQSAEAQTPASAAAPGPASAVSVAPQTSPLTTTAATPAAPAKPDERMMERQLRLQGYRLSMVHGDEKYCRREAPLGSRLESVMHCVTVTEAEAMAREGRETTERIQQHTPGCLQPSQGGCGH